MTAELDELQPDLDGDQAQPETYYPDVYGFVPDLLAELYARPVSDQQTAFRWCARWWAHPEAVARLEALWRAWEALRLDPGTGLATWWLRFADDMMAALCDPDGPFRGCSGTAHKPPPVLPCTAAPDGLANS
jgi:hypothetical protein